jgi:cyclopropane fatty-acyl-phospholipid synthase-like methyltransferase
MTDSQYWQHFWDKHVAQNADEDPQKQILRTLNREPIDQDLWSETLSFVLGHLELQPNDRVLDLCCGNGLFSHTLAELAAQVTAVDLAEGLLKQIDTTTHPNISVVHANLLSLEQQPGTAEKILFYAGLQYFSKGETVELFRKIHRWLTPGGSVYVGDIPDAAKKWDFFNKPERRAAYFRSLVSGEPIVGTWFKQDFLDYLARDCGFERVEIIPQPQDQIYAFFRYDMKLVK